MIVSELIEELKQYDDSFEVVFAVDAEGNRFKPICDVSYGEYDPENAWGGDYQQVERVTKKRAFDCNNYVVHPNAVCLHPIN